MKRLTIVAVIACAVGQACFLSSSKSGAANELAALANKVSETTYAAVYEFVFTSQPAPGETDKLEISQMPPTTLRELQQSTRSADNKTLSIRNWYLTRATGSFACTEYPNVGVKCMKDPIQHATFGSAKFDVYFDDPKDPTSYASVRKIARSDRIAGQQATCFETAPAEPSPPPPTSEPAEGRYRYELCYTSDGILLRGRRATLDEAAGGAADTVVQAISISRVVEPGDLRLPGPVVDVSDVGR